MSFDDDWLIEPIKPSLLSQALSVKQKNIYKNDEEDRASAFHFALPPPV